VSAWIREVERVARSFQLKLTSVGPRRAASTALASRRRHGVQIESRAIRDLDEPVSWAGSQSPGKSGNGHTDVVTSAISARKSRAGIPATPAEPARHDIHQYRSHSAGETPTRVGCALRWPCAPPPSVITSKEREGERRCGHFPCSLPPPCCARSP
jgi:hypothetical protein